MTASSLSISSTVVGLVLGFGLAIALQAPAQEADSSGETAESLRSLGNVTFSEFRADTADGHDPDTVTMTRAGRSFCALTAVRLENLVAAHRHGGCDVEGGAGAGEWSLRAVRTGEGVTAFCEATCMSW